jgi:hypothetical protein
MATGGKGGGGGGGSKGGGKGGGGKGKKGGICSAGDIVNFGPDLVLYQTVKQAFDNAVPSADGKAMIVQLECTVAQNLVIGIAGAMSTSFTSGPKGKKGGK